MNELFSFVQNHQCSFYRDFWDGAESLDDVPCMTRERFARTSYMSRRYVDTRSILKIVNAGQPWVSEWGIETLRKEPFGIPSSRPMVYLHSSHEAVEKGIWCYENEMTRLVGEQNPALASFMAEQFDIDSLITDPESFVRIMPYLRARTEKLSSMSILATSFDTAALAEAATFAERVRLVLALPETGVIAEADFNGTAVFKPSARCTIEVIDQKIVVSKLERLVTPIIRYDTGILADTIGGALVIA